MRGFDQAQAAYDARMPDEGYPDAFIDWCDDEGREADEDAFSDWEDANEPDWESIAEDRADFDREDY